MWLPRGRPAVPTADAVLGIAWTGAALVASVAVPGVLWAGLQGPATARLLPLALAVLAFARPLHAVLVVAALAPISGLLATVIGAKQSVTALLLPGLLLGTALRVSSTPRALREVPAGLRCAGLLLALLALASAAVQAESASLFSPSRAEWIRALVATTTRTSGGAQWHGVSQGLALAQMALAALLVAATVATEEDAGRVRRMLVAGATAAAAFNVAFLLSGALRSGGGFSEAWALAGRTRISAAFGDVNAAGSFFACMALLAAGAAVVSWRRRDAGAFTASAGCTILLLCGLFLAGSRVAAAALPLGLAAAAIARVPRRPWSATKRAAVLVAAVALALVIGALVDARRGSGDSSNATFIRVEFARTTWRMLSDHPVFGVGAGRFREASGHYSSDALKRIYPTQNAHNNFLQIAGELGPVALGAFVLLVGLPVVSLWAKTAEAPGPHATMALAGLIVFLLTCMGGHPLLVDEVRAWFAVLLGMASAMPFQPSRSAAARTPSRARLAASTVALAVLVLACTFPARVRAEKQQAPLEHVVLGPARWVRERGGEPQITFRGRLTMYTPASRGVLLTMRRAPGQPTRQIEIQILLDGTLANAIALEDGDWMEVPLFVPQKGPLAFRRLTLDARWTGSARGKAPRIQLRRIRQLD